jgi:protein SCO1/2
MMAVMVFASSVCGQVINPDDPALRGIDVIEHLGDTIPLDLVLTNDAGEEVLLGQYFSEGKPVLLIMAYYTCPMLCNLVMNGVTEGVRDISLSPGEDYNILTVSIDPTETLELAAAKKKNYVNSFDREGAGEGWTFFIASEDQSRKLADAVGFKYYYDEDLQQYAHAAVVTVLSGKGVISRYLYGIEFKSRDVKLAMLEASEGKIGTTMDRILLFCYHYDPDSGGYTLFATNVMKLGGLVTLVFMTILLSWLWWRERRRRTGRLGTV